jgi:hypothetical protein
MRKMGWSDFGPAEAGEIAETIIANLHAMIRPGEIS